MKPITIKVNRPKNIQAALAYAKTEAANHQITCTLHENHGNGSGHGFSGHYAIHPNYIEITVTSKPLWVTAATVEKKIREYCNDYLRREI